MIHPCSSAGLVIEVDGDVHGLQKEEDERREKVLSEMGLRIVRFRNDEVVKNLSAVVGRIRSMLVYLATR
ncbi:MAG: endonuclease domain-containing protein [Anaerolineales bacterium]|nr:endonuclease domain-containing protein [Anaerolineales bacterium]